MDAPAAGSAWRAFKATIVYQALRSQRRWLWLLLALTLVSLVVTASMIATIKAVFDDAIIAGSTPLDELVATLYALAVIGFAAGLAVRLVSARVVYQLEYDMRCWLYDRLQGVDPRSLDRLAAGQLVTRALTDLNFLEQVTAVLPVLLVGGVIVLAIIGVMIAINPLLGIITLLAFPANGLIVARMAKRLRALSWLSLHRRAEVTTAIDEPVRGIRVVKAFGAEEPASDTVAEAARHAFAVAIARIRLLARYGLPVKMIPILLDAVLVYLGARMAIDGTFSIGSLVVYLGFAIFFTSLAGQLDEAVSSYQFARTGAGRIFELMADAAPGQGPAVPLPAPPGSGLSLRRVTTRAGAAIDLVLAPGSWAAITGPPGSGTSEAGRVAVGAQGPSGGQVALDGIAIDQIARDELRASARLLESEPFLFGRTVRENLRMGAGADAGDGELDAALAAAGADGFVASIGGLDAPIGDRGLTLSGGQRQRLALARAIVRPPRLLVLDDALSAVNPTLEVEVLERLRVHAPDTAVLLVTRREGPLRLAEQVVELADPVVVETAPAHPDEPDAPDFARPADARLARAVDAADVPDIAPDVDEAAATDDASPPTLGNIVRPVRGGLAKAILLLILLSFVTVVPTALYQYAVNGIRANDPGPATVVALALTPVAAAITVLTYLLRVVVTRVNETVLYVLRRRTFRRLSRLGIDYYDRELPGRVASRVVYDLDRITEFINNGVYPLAASVFLFFTAMVVLAFASPTAFWGVAPYLPFMVLGTALEIPLAERAYRRARAGLGHVVERFQEDFSGRHVIASFGGQAAARAGFRALSWDLRRRRRRAATISNVYLAAMELLAALATATLIARAAGLAIEQEATIGSVVFLQLLLTQALAPIATLSGVLQTYLNARASLHELAQPFEATVLPVAPTTALPCPPLSGQLDLRGVTFRYPGTDRVVLDDVSLHVSPGEVVALVGPTGAGKSSIAKLIGRLYDPDGGTVAADGIDLRTLDLHGYRRRLGVVPQDAFCFRGTVASNVAFGKPDATRSELHAALERCGGSGVLARLPAGLDSEVEEEGRNLSPVARQWLALARAWLVAPDVLVLDEATSVLPADDEQRVVDALRSLGRTAVLVTHRLPVAARADRVVVVEEGRIVEQGSHPDLLAAGGRYAELWAHGADGVLVDGAAAAPAAIAALDPG